MRALALLAVALCLAGSAPAAAQSAHTHEHRFEDAEKWARVFDDPARDAWQKPHEVILALGLARDARVADLGAGTGYFTARLAHAVPQGRVYGVDTEPDMVKYLGERARREGLANVVPVASRPDDAALPAPVDLVLLVDVYHHIGDRVSYFRRLSGSLRPGGRVAVIDFTGASPSGPPKKERIAASRVRSEMERAGYALAEEHRFLPHQYFLIFRRPAP
jgi:predicted methyltransferase